MNTPWFMDCEHTQSAPRRFLQSNGVTVVVLQCLQCGHNLGQRKKSNYNIDLLPEFDNEKREYVSELRSQYRRDAWQAKQDEYERERRQKIGEWWNAYNRYLRTQQWQQLRRRVIARDGFACQNCFRKVTADSAHVHHLSYEGYKNTGQSFAFECVTLCRSCHDAYHEQPMEVAA